MADAHMTARDHAKVVDLSTPLQELLAYCRTQQTMAEIDFAFHVRDAWKSRGDALEVLLREFGCDPSSPPA